MGPRADARGKPPPLGVLVDDILASMGPRADCAYRNVDLTENMELLRFLRQFLDRALTRSACWPLLPHGPSNLKPHST